MTGALLRTTGLTKRFGAFTALDQVDLTLAPGEIHALLGENGAGKSTFVKLLYGVLEPTAGTLEWNGREIDIPNPHQARALGIGMVFQHFSLFEALSVTENVALALPPEPRGTLARRIGRVAAEYGLDIDPDAGVHALSVGEKQRVEILRCLLQNPKLLIMDEPTSVLTPHEAGRLFTVLRRLADQGCAILYITHRLGEVQALCQRATVLRQGRVVGRIDPRATSVAEMAALMVGQPVADLGRSAVPDGPVRLELAGLYLPGDGAFATPLAGINLAVRGGEVLGIAGVAGMGQAELMAALIGERLAPRAEMIRLDGAAVGRADPTRRRRLGAAFVPEERSGHASVPGMTLPPNLLLSHHGAEGLAPRAWIDFAATRAWSARVREAFDVRASAADPIAGSLSGGNLQKFVVGREILRRPGILAVAQPTWGVDAGAARLIRQGLMDLARGGAAVLVISQDLDEIFGLCDRIAVLHRGHLTAPRPTRDLGPAEIGLMMAGLPPEAAA